METPNEGEFAVWRDCDGPETLTHQPFKWGGAGEGVASEPLSERGRNCGQHLNSEEKRDRKCRKRSRVSPQYRREWNGRSSLFQIKEFATGLVQKYGKLLVNKRNIEIKNKTNYLESKKEQKLDNQWNFFPLATELLDKLCVVIILISAIKGLKMLFSHLLSPCVGAGIPFYSHWSNVALLLLLASRRFDKRAHLPLFGRGSAHLDLFISCKRGSEERSGAAR